MWPHFISATMSQVPSPKCEAKANALTPANTIVFLLAMSLILSTTIVQGESERGGEGHPLQVGGGRAGYGGLRCNPNTRLSLTEFGPPRLRRGAGVT